VALLCIQIKHQPVLSHLQIADPALERVVDPLHCSMSRLPIISVPKGLANTNTGLWLYDCMPLFTMAACVPTLFLYYRAKRWADLVRLVARLVQQNVKERAVSLSFFVLMLVLRSTHYHIGLVRRLCSA